MIRLGLKSQSPTTTEIREVADIIGSTILDKYSDTDIAEMISTSDAMSLPNDTIYTNYPEDLALTAHEIEHQSQYQNGEKEVFETLVREALDGASGKSDPYSTPGTLEYEAQQVQEKAGEILESRSMIW